MRFIYKLIVVASLMLSLPSYALLSKVTLTAETKKNQTYDKYGVKGADLHYVKVSDKVYRYKIKGKYYVTLNKADSLKLVQTGTASYYGGKFHGRKTASGEIFDKNAYTAAHKSLALGSYALVTHLRSGKQIIVRINDRGPFVKDRILDLSVASAKALNIIHSGLGKVKIEAIQVDAQGYLVGTGTQSLYQIAKKSGIPLKIKKYKNGLAIKAL